MMLEKFIRGMWTRLWLRRSKFSGRYGDLERLYALRDPWNLSGSGEQSRFEQTNQLIAEWVPDCRSLLEIGCGEGLQTEHLKRISKSVVGLDISATAIGRARARLPTVEFKIGRAEDAAGLFPGRKFDLLTAFEMLYYSTDIPAMIVEMQQLSDTLLVTNYAERAEVMGHHFEGPGWQRLRSISADGQRWDCHLWRARRQ